MCYSAMVKQNVKKLGLTYNARVQLDLFEEVYEMRAKGSGAKIPRAMDYSFHNPENAQEKRILKLISNWNENLVKESEHDLFVLRKRLVDAERKLKLKETKSALADQRIATDKIAKIKLKLKDLGSAKVEDFARIFPHVYAPLLVEENGERVIKPFRYHLRPRGQSPDFDKKFDGNYNARRDRLKEVYWWKSLFGKNHGVLVISKFWENVKQASENVVLEFKPEDQSELLIPCIFDHAEDAAFTLNSFALITDEPNPEVAAAGHDRTPVMMKDEYLDLWLQTSGKSLRDFELVLEDKKPTYFLHSVAG
jgi:putative SOS response-associated peptidase YedK